MWPRWRAMRGCCWMRAIGSRRRARSISSRTPRTWRRSFRFRASGLHETFEQFAELAGAPKVFRVPLHGDAIARVIAFHRFDHAVGRGGRHFEPLRRLLDRLMM